MYIVLFIIIITLILIGLEWFTRLSFLAEVYCRRNGHGKSWNRAHKHYKTNWTLLQRLFWLPLFKEKYERRHKIIAYLSYIHIVITLLTFITFLLSELSYYRFVFWRLFLIFAVLFTIMILTRLNYHVFAISHQPITYRIIIIKIFEGVFIVGIIIQLFYQL